MKTNPMTRRKAPRGREGGEADRNAKLMAEECPWLGFTGKAGTKKYAEQSAAFLSDAMNEPYVVAVTKRGWWHAKPHPTRRRAKQRRGT